MNLYRILKRARVFNAAYVLINLIKTLISSIHPFANIIIPALIINELLADKDISRLAFLVALMAGINLLYKTFIAYIEALIIKQASAINMRFDLLISEISMSLPYHLLETDKMIQMIKGVKEGAARAGGISSLIDAVFRLASYTITALGTVALMANLDFWLIGLAIVTIIVNTLVQSKIKKHDISFFSLLMKHNTKFMHLIGVILNRRYAKDIRLYEANRTFTAKMDDFTLEVDSFFKVVGRKKIKVFMLANLTDSISQALIYGYLAFRFIGGFITVGLFTMYINAVTTFTDTIVSAMKTVLDIYEKRKWLKPSFDFLDYQKDTVMTDETTNTKRLDNPVIEFRNVSFRYENSHEYALKNVSLAIPYGQKLSVVGMNGAGKTTLIKLLLRLYTPTDGEIYIDGHNINEYSFDEYRKLFSVVFQDFKLMAATVTENIICSEVSPQDENLKTSLVKSGIYDRIEKMPMKYDTQLYKLFDSDGIDLSGGEEQRLAISRALYKNAPIVILDEPTSALDPKTEYEIYTGMDKLAENRTSIYISHRMTSCIFCDMVAVFHDGELIQYGNHGQLINQNNLYAQMFNTQAQYYL